MVTEQELMKFKVPELKQKLQELGIQPRGLKADLVRQLCEALNSIEMQQQQHHYQQQQQEHLLQQFELQQQQQQQYQQQQLLILQQQQFEEEQRRQQEQQLFLEQRLLQEAENQRKLEEQRRQQELEQRLLQEQQEQQRLMEEAKNKCKLEEQEKFLIEEQQRHQEIELKQPQQQFEQNQQNNEIINFSNNQKQEMSALQLDQLQSSESIDDSSSAAASGYYEQHQSDDIEGESSSNQKSEDSNDGRYVEQADSNPYLEQVSEIIEHQAQAQMPNLDDEESQSQQELILQQQLQQQQQQSMTACSLPTPPQEEELDDDTNQINYQQQQESSPEESLNDNQVDEIKYQSQSNTQKEGESMIQIKEEDGAGKENQAPSVIQVPYEEDEEDGVYDQQKLLQALNITKEEWSQMSKNHRRKLKKKLRNKMKRQERDEIEKHRQELKKKQRELEKQQNEKLEQLELMKQENQDDDDRMDIDEEDAPEEEKEQKRLEELRRQQELLAKQQKEENKKKDDFVEIEYIPEEMPKDAVYLQFLKVFDKFSAVTEEERRRLEMEKFASEQKNNKYRTADERAKLLELKKPVELELKDDDDGDGEGTKLSKRKLKQLTRMSVADLKQRVTHPELVEMHDVTARDPVLLLYLKSTRNTVPVPRHWCYKRKYLQGKRGFEKPAFKLPEFIRRTGIQEMREAILEKEDAKSLKTKMKEKIRPKMGKIDIDYQKLHDAFFKWQTKPKVTIHGDLYYEGKEFETRLKDKKPGELTNDLRTALGMPTGPNAHKCPPPWLIAMQRYGPPPSYPNIKIPGLNAPIPEGCCFGYHAGGWGKPPVDEYGRPLYGDVFGLTSNSREQIQPEEEVDRTHWGEMESDEEEEEESDEDEDETKNGDKDEDQSGLVTPAVEGLVTPSGITTGISSGLETPDMIELRKRKQAIEMEMESGDQQQLFTVIPEKKVDRFAKDMMGSMHVYDFASLSKTTSTSSKPSNGGVEVALDPSELESGQLDSTAVAAKYEQTLRDQSYGGKNNPHEDLSDMVAEYASKQKRKKHDSSSKRDDHSGSSGTSTSKSSKKYQFKF